MTTVTDLPSLLRWHRERAQATKGASRELHLTAVRLIQGVIKRRADHTASIVEGLAKAKSEGRPTGGRSRVDPTVERRIRRMLQDGATVMAIREAVGCGASVVMRVKAAMANEE